jgi:hypothetical protein
MRKITLTLAISLLFAGSAVWTADAQTSRGAANVAHADRTGGLPGMGTLLPAWIYADLRPVSLLVSSLLVAIDIENEAAADGGLVLTS